jgi:hypothetical protein
MKDENDRNLPQDVLQEHIRMSKPDAKSKYMIQVFTFYSN